MLFKFLSLGHTVCHLATSPSMTRAFPLLCESRKCGAGVGRLNPTPPGFLSGKLSLSWQPASSCSLLSKCFSRRNLIFITHFKGSKGKEGCNPSESKILVILPVGSSGSTNGKRGVWRASEKYMVQAWVKWGPPVPQTTRAETWAGLVWGMLQCPDFVKNWWD